MIDASRFYEYIVVKAVKAKSKTEFQKEMASHPQWNKDAYQFFVLQDHDEDHLFGDADFLKKTWADTQRYILALKNLVEEDNARFGMFYIPIEAQLKLDDYGESNSRFFSKRASQRFNRLLERFAKENNIAFLDIQPSLQANSKEPLYFYWDGHLNQTGHEVVAGALSRFIKNEFK